MNYHPPMGAASDRFIAIVGMACRFPGAGDPSALWRLLIAGEHALREVPSERWAAADYVDADRRAAAKMVTARGGFLDQVDEFDAAFFGVSAREAAQVDPQQRLALELAWESLEDAGIAPDRLRGSNTAVYMGAMWTDYARLHDIRGIEQHSGTGWHLGVVPGRVSYALGLRGPSMAVNTACSSSLVAVHLACKALLERETDLALAGGVSLMLTPHVGVAMSKFGGTSASGRCFAYDARADGYVRGEGGGVVALRRYADALASGDPIIAVIRASAVNNDGHGVGLTVPTEAAQRDLLREVYARAQVDPRAVVFVEGHGTGTPVGDPIEARSLGAELGGDARTEPLWLGSIKPNIGHTEAASGVASLIKTALALREGLIPPNRNFEQPNPAIDFEALRLRVPTAPCAWTGPRIAGINSFGFGGTNCHLVLSAAPALEHATLAQPDRAPTTGPPGPPAGTSLDRAQPRLIVASARDAGALRARLSQLRSAAADQDQGPDAARRFADLAHTQWHRRAQLEHRAFVCAASFTELRESLDAETCAQWELRGERSPLVFAFSGQGSQWPAMGRELLAHQPAFAASLRRCAQLMAPMIGWDVHAAIAKRELAPRLEFVDGIQPAIFAIQVALAATWASLGVRPDAVVGHSMGEVAAAVAAGAISLEDGARITCVRARLLHRISGRGGMLSLELPLTRVEALFASSPVRYAGLGVAVDGGASSTVVSGGLEALARLRADLDGPAALELVGRPVEVRDVAVDVAAHSEQVDALSDEFLAQLQGVSSRPTCVRMLSSVTGGEIDHSMLTPAYWVANLRQRVRFAEAAGLLLERDDVLFIEPSPHPLLTWPLRQMAKARGFGRVRALGSMRRARSERAQLLEAAGWLHLYGHAVALEQPGHLLSLPPYPWQRRRYWPSPRTPARGTTQAELSVRFSPARLPALAAHRVEGRATLSAGVCLELCLRALALLEPDATLRVDALEFLAPVAGTDAVRLELEAHEQTRALSLTLADAGPTPGVRARLLPLALTPSLSSPRPDQLTSERSGSEHYARLREQGIEYGEALAAVEALALGPGVARVRVGAETRRPALLDACFQAALAALDARGNEQALVVTRLASATLDPAQLERATAIHARAAAHGEGRHEAEVWLLDEHGRTLAHLRGIEFRAREVGESVLRRQRWRSVTRPATRAPRLPPGRPPRRVLITPASSPHAGRLASSFRRHGHGQEHHAGARVRVASASELASALSEGCDALVWLAPYTSPAEGELLERTASACAAFVDALRSCAKLPETERPELVLVSECALLVDADDEVSLGSSALHGLARVARVEHPELALTQLDLGSLGAAGPASEALLAALVTELAQPGRASTAALRWRDAVGRCARLIPTLEPLVLPSETWQARRGTVVVSGGLGGIGRVLVRDLAERGAETLLLLGRRALDEEAAAWLVELAASTGARLRYAAVDVSDRAALAAALADTREDIIGVVHTAVALSDGPLLAHTHTTFEQALRAKLGGAWNLHECCAGLELDFFVLFGSLGGWIGLPGQASYAAANAALDGLAAHRHARGLPAASVGWCGWSGLGFARSAGGSTSLEHLAAEGIASLEPRAALELCAAVLANPQLPPMFAVMPPLDAAGGSASARLDADSDAARQLGQQLRELGVSARREALRELVLRETAAVLREEPERVEPHRPLRELGLDSLMSVELGERLSRLLGIGPAATLIWRYPTVEALAAHALAQLDAAASTSMPSTSAPSTSAPSTSPPVPATPAPTTPVPTTPVPATSVPAPEQPPPTDEGALEIDELEALADELSDLSDEEVEALTRVL